MFIKPKKKFFLTSVAPYYKTAAATYQGPGDVVSGAITWVSPARAYSAAFAALAGPMMDIVDSGNANAATINVLTTGFVDLTTLNAWIVAHGTASVKKLYDHTGTGNHFTQATVANMPTIAQNALNGLPGLTGSAGTFNMATGNITQAQPWSFSYVAERTGAFTTISNVFSISGGSIFAGFTAVASTAGFNASSGTLSVAATDSAFHAMQVIGNGASSVMVVEAATTSGNAGATGLSATPLRLMTSNGSGTGLTGLVMEAGMWPAAFNATQYGNMNTNQHSAANGYNF